jgi:isopenicillin N synthase-like dioxygenase
MPHNTSSTAMVNGAKIDIAPLEVVDFARLASKEPAEVEKLLKAAESPGFFYLDLQSGSTRKYLANVQDMYAMADKYFDQPHHVKMKDYRESEDRGYVFLVTTALLPRQTQLLTYHRYKPSKFDSSFEVTPLLSLPFLRALE